MKLNLSVGVVAQKSEAELQTMRVGGLIWQNIRDYLVDSVKPGMSLKEVEKLTKAQFGKYGVVSSFDKSGDFPSIMCLSLNDCVVHGAASEELIRPGDKLTLDFGFSYLGLNIDAAFSMFFHPEKEEEKTLGRGGIKKLEEYSYLDQLTKALFYEAISGLKAGELTGAITERIENFFCKYFPKKYSLLEKFTGHGIGKKLHEFPRVHNFGMRKVEGVALPVNSTICIEPMIIEQKDGSWIQREGDCGVYAKDRNAQTLHYEHLVAVKADGVEVLTASLQEMRELKSTWELVKKL
ncbi:M24 family metallopeptidase [Candidatus Mycoplasma haematominutum]|uniref:Methionine aminopeptidase n=1 Tax=Candidatus Mycoplasma haematominutum 'Birmingham 1' TaxID=1116213 RepID=G8C336_9MOLU|nr:methionyl aminopeptidase [Candidatus Mycoplasma haematominutum]CCE66734.1 methionine aminopeptidase [Candidatus Mycoplasma haematominutum 'Birmingham 1']